MSQPARFHLHIRLDVAPGATPQVDLQTEGRPVPSPGQAMQENGLRAREWPMPWGRFVELSDASTATRLFWCSLPWNDGPDLLELHVEASPALSPGRRGGFLADGTRLDCAASRNLAPDDATLPAGPQTMLSGLWRRTRRGPTHLLWVAHPASDGPMERCKDVGVDEDGGMKFRFETYGYVAFQLTPALLESASWRHPERPIPRYVLMRYDNRELSTIWTFDGHRIVRRG